MLIVPVHQRLEPRNIPWVSLAIALLCILIFAGPQQGDVAIEERALALYEESDLASIEMPLYLKYVEAHPEALFHQYEESEDQEALVFLMIWDRGFRQSLAVGEGFADAGAAQDWTSRSRAFRATSDSMVSERFTMKSSTPTTYQALTSTFLHGDWGHVIGNLTFLMILGLLVERALGAWLFLVLYLVSGVTAAWFWALTALPGASSLGASGAISGLMGALCVLWGMRRIRFFYWFLIFFDYVRAPAIWLLVPWLGWELVQWATEDGSRVAYSAHAGGIISGALIAALIRWQHWDRPEAYEETVGGNDRPEQMIATAKSALGRLAFDEADAALAPLLELNDAPFEARLLSLRIATTARRAAAAEWRARELLSASARGDEHEQRLDALTAWVQSGGRWSAAEAMIHAQWLAGRGRCDEAAAMLAEAARSGEVPTDWASAWLRLAFDRQRDGDASGAKCLFAALAEALPESPEATKARSFA